MRDLETQAKYTRGRNYERTPRCVWFNNSVKMFPSSPRKKEGKKGKGYRFTAPDVNRILIKGLPRAHQNLSTQGP